MKNTPLIEAAEKEFSQAGSSRREALSKAIRLGLKAAFIALPLGLFEATQNKVFASPTSAVTDILNYALTLEYLENEFYATGLGTAGLIPASDQTVIAQIGKHEASHVTLLKTTIGQLGGTAVDKPEFDFTAGGAFADVFSNYTTFLALANAFEDTGVRAYKGQAAALVGQGDVLTAALNIHSVEARHASEVRRMRGLKGWITNAEAGGLPAAIYAGEDNYLQAGVDVRTLTMAPATAITECFDEPMAMTQVLAIAGGFIK